MSSVDTDQEHEGGEALELLYRLAGVGISLSAEHDIDNLLDRIVYEASGLTNADGVTLYLLKDEQLHFTISRNRLDDGRLGEAVHGGGKFPPVPLDPSFVSAYAAINKETVNIEDVYQTEGFDFSGPKKYDTQTGYRSVSMLATPMLNHEYEVIGVLQLLNALEPGTRNVIPFSKKAATLAECLGSQAAIALTNFRLVQETEDLFESFLRVMAAGLDARSKYTSGHVRRVAGLTMELAQAINETDDGPYRFKQLDEDELAELRIAGWMHDIGKIVSPPHIMDKGKKLETIFDRHALIKTRYDYIRAETEKEYLLRKIDLLNHGAPKADIAACDKEMNITLTDLDDECEFVLSCNSSGEFMEDEKIERLEQIARKTYRVDGESLHRLSSDELLNLSIRKGTLTSEERQIMQDHIVVTNMMLEKMTFPNKFRKAPLYAGSHHETLDGKGYPKGLTGDQMPLQSRILCITDFLEALMSTDRPYKKPMPLEKAFSILDGEAERGKLDADLLAILKEKNVFQCFDEKDKRGEFQV